MSPPLKPSLAPCSRVSVILAVRNGSPWISEQLMSIAAQHLDPAGEMVFAENGSTDNTQDIVTDCASAFEGSADRFTYLNAGSKPGKPHAVREGVHASQGDLLIFVDHDDVCT